jgi:hypothetical protein
MVAVPIYTKMFLSKWESNNWVQKQTAEKGIAQKWDNSQDITFTITENGSYKVDAYIYTSSNIYYPVIWVDETGPMFTRP